MWENLLKSVIWSAVGVGGSGSRWAAVQRECFTERNTQLFLTSSATALKHTHNQTQVRCKPVKCQHGSAEFGVSVCVVSSYLNWLQLFRGRSVPVCVCVCVCVCVFLDHLSGSFVLSADFQIFCLTSVIFSFANTKYYLQHECLSVRK